MLSLINIAFSNVEYNGIFKKIFKDKVVIYDASGTSMQFINGSNQRTKPEYAIDPTDKKYDWCSNCGKTYEDLPWIAFSLKEGEFKFNGYFMRAGCCYGGCCCEDYGYCVDCCLYSWNLQISDDNKTWTEIHKVEKDQSMRICNEKSYNLEKYYKAKYIKIAQTEHCPGNPPCLAINKFDLFGDVVRTGANNDEDFTSYHDGSHPNKKSEAFAL